MLTAVDSNFFVSEKLGVLFLPVQKLGVPVPSYPVNYANAKNKTEYCLTLTRRRGRTMELRIL